MRNPLKRRPRDEAKPTLRERFAATKAKAGALLLRPRPDHEADQGRRAVLAGSLAVAIPLPALAASTQPDESEAAFLALTLELLPLLRRFESANEEVRRLGDLVDAAAGVHPGWHNDEAGSQAWVVRHNEARETFGLSAAWTVSNNLARTLSSIADPFINAPIRTLPGIALKASLNGLGDWWGESALNDLHRLGAEQFGLSFEEPEPLDLVVPEDDEASA